MQQPRLTFLSNDHRGDVMCMNEFGPHPHHIKLLTYKRCNVNLSRMREVNDVYVNLPTSSSSFFAWSRDLTPSNITILSCMICPFFKSMMFVMFSSCNDQQNYYSEFGIIALFTCVCTHERERQSGYSFMIVLLGFDV